MNLEGYGMKQSWPNLRYYPGFCLEGLRKIRKTLSGEDSRSSGRYLNPGPPEFEAGVITTGRDVRCRYYSINYRLITHSLPHNWFHCTHR
jgi:hypothetical protein